jgi:hypothetical protein
MGINFSGTIAALLLLNISRFYSIDFLFIAVMIFSLFDYRNFHLAVLAFILIPLSLWIALFPCLCIYQL